MMKKNWVRPVATVEEFMADEYCSTCGTESEQFYNFYCNAGSSNVLDSQYVFLDHNGNGVFDSSDEEVIFDPDPTDSHSGSKYFSFRKCGEVHGWCTEADIAKFKNGFLVSYDADGQQQAEKVKIWFETGKPYPTPIHCTKALDDWNNTWEVAKS